MYWPKYKARGVVCPRNRGSSIPFTYLGIALDRGVVQSSHLVQL